MIKAFRIGPSRLDPVVRYLHALATGYHITRNYYYSIRILNAAYGGTGVVIDTILIEDYHSRVDRSRVVLAGGLTPANVAYAIRTAQPAAVDAASGVESSPGKKDPAAVAAFVQAARAAFAEIAAK